MRPLSGADITNLPLAFASGDPFFPVIRRAVVRVDGCPCPSTYPTGRKAVEVHTDLFYDFHPLSIMSPSGEIDVDASFSPKEGDYALNFVNRT